MQAARHETSLTNNYVVKNAHLKGKGDSKMSFYPTLATTMKSKNSN